MPEQQDQTKAWQCPRCEETVEPGFAVCWRCGATRGGTSDPAFQPEVGRVQDRALCATCQYPLRGLTGERCPECGTPFDREKVDTLAEGPPPPTTTSTQRWQWGITTVVSWIAMLAIALLMGHADPTDAWWAGYLPTLFIVALVVALVSPLRLFVLMFRPLEQ